MATAPEVLGQGIETTSGLSLFPALTVATIGNQCCKPMTSQ